MTKKRILIAPLNWGLGHATRCIPVIKKLLEHDFEPVIASDGDALKLLQKEFPDLKTLELPSYRIEYAENEKNFKWKLFKQIPNLFKAVKEEKKIVQKWISEHHIQGIISDNRLGVFSNKVPSVFITHQLNVLSGSTSWLTTKIHHLFIKKFDQCWVPDNSDKPNLSGKLGHYKSNSITIKYLGPLSRFEKFNTEQIYDLAVILSGPEPQRTLLEEKLKHELKDFNGKIVFVRGLVGAKQESFKRFNIDYFNFMKSDELEMVLNQSKIVLSRSGYTTLMDLAKLEKKAFFIPTPGQYEQEYLAKKLKKKGLIPYSRQHEFKVDHLYQVDLYKGLKDFNKTECDWEDLFSIFD